jgi:hypothetical protein
MKQKILLTLLNLFFLIVLGTTLIVPKTFAQAAAGNPSSDNGCDPGQSGLDLSKCYRLNDKQTVAEVYKDPAFLVNLIVRNVFVLAGVIIFFMIMYAGFLFITGSTKGKDQASKILESCLWGFAIMFAAFWIVQIIKIITGTPIGL